jgi:hypothetical protein
VDPERRRKMDLHRHVKLSLTPTTSIETSE